MLPNEVVKCLDVHLCIADNVGSDIFTAIRIVKRAYRHIPYARIFAYYALHLLQLDAESAYLDQSVLPAHKLQVAVGQVAHHVTGAIDTLVSGFVGKWIADIYLCRLFRMVKVATAHLRACYQQFACRTGWQPVQLFVNDVELGIAGWLAYRNILFILLQSVGGGEYRTLRGTISVEHGVVLWRLQCRKFLSSHSKIAERMIIHIGSKLITHLCSDKGVGDAVTVVVFVQCRQVQSHILFNDIDTCPTGDGGIYVHHAGIKSIAGIGSHPAGGVHLRLPLVPVTEVHQISVLQLASLRQACRARCIKQYEEV